MRTEPSRPPLGLRGGFLTLGVTYGAIRTQESDRTTNDNHAVAVFRLGRRLNRHLAVALEGSYWDAETRTLDLASGGQMSLSQPLSEEAATVTLPLYFHLSDRIPLVLYAGPGLAWEARDVVQLDSADRVLSRHRARGSGLAWVAGAGLEFPLNQQSSVALLARVIHTRMDSLSAYDTRDLEERPERTVLSIGAALSFYP